MSQPLFTIDLHTHTTRSDGNDSVTELLGHAAARGMSVVAITDHDVLPPEGVSVDGRLVPLGEFARSFGISVIPGTEVSCDTFVDDVHIVGFGCEWKSPLLQWIPELARTSKINGYKQVVDRLRKSGFDVCWEELTNGGTRSDDAVQKKHIFELIALKGHAPNWQAAKLMIRENPDFDVKREKPSPFDTIKSIHEAGGIAILAHPYLIDAELGCDGETLTRRDYILRLIDAGLDGIETCYTYDKTSYTGTQTSEEIQREVERLYDGAVSIFSGGSDYHADAKKGVVNARELGDAGVTPDYFWSHPILSRLCESKR